MKKIFELGIKDFLSGVSETSHGNKGGLFFEAKGVAPFVSPRRTSNDFGLLQTFAAPTDMTGAIVVDVPFVWASEATASNTGFLYMLGNAGNFYVIVLSSNAITNERSGGSKISNPAMGLVIYKEKLYYAQKTQVGQVTEGTPPFDTGSTWDNDWSTAVGGGSALESSIYHPMHLFSGRVWIGNGLYIDSITGSSPDYNSKVLTLESDYRVLCLSDDGFFIVAGITQNLGDLDMMGKTKIIFWDTFSSLVSREWPIPEAHVSSIKRLGGQLYAVTSGGIYRFSYSSPPVKVVEGVDCLYGRHSAVDILEGNMLAVGRRSNEITTYGPPMAGYPPVVFSPFTGWANGQGVHTLASTAKRGTVYFGTNDSKLYRQNMVTGGATSLNAKTNFIPLREKYLVEEIKIILGTDLSSGDSLNIDVSADDGDTASDWGTASFANHGAVRRVTLTGSFEAEALQLVLNYNGGNVKIKRIEVYGTPQPRAMK